MNAGVDVVEQQSDAHAAIGSPEDLTRQQKAGQIVLPIIILQVEAATGPASGMGPRDKSLDIIGYERDGALFAAGREKRSDILVDAGPFFTDRKCERRIGLRSASEPAVDVKDCDEEQGEEDRRKSAIRTT